MVVVDAMVKVGNKRTIRYVAISIVMVSITSA